MSSTGKNTPKRELSPKTQNPPTMPTEAGAFGQAVGALNQPPPTQVEPPSGSGVRQTSPESRGSEGDREGLRQRLTNVDEDTPQSVGRRKYLPGALLSAVLVPGKRLNVTKTGVLPKPKVYELECAVMNIQVEPGVRICDIITTPLDIKGFKTAFWIYLYLHASGEEGVADRGLIGYDGTLNYDDLEIQSETIADVLKPFQVIRYMRARADEISKAIRLVRTDFLDQLASADDEGALEDARAMVTEIDTRAAQYGVDPPQHAFPGSSHISTLSFSARAKLEAANKAFLRERITARMYGGMRMDDSQVGRQ